MSSETTNNDPWSQTTQETEAQSNPWAQDSPTTANNDWLNTETVDEKTFDVMNPFQDAVLPLDTWVESGLDWLV